MQFQNTLAFAQQCDAEDSLKHLRTQFHFPQHEGQDTIYFCGNSLGLQPKKVEEYMLQELADWKKYGVEGHFMGKNPWKDYQEWFSLPLSKVVGALPEEVVVMNGLTSNLHFLMVSFYRPTAHRYKILVEKGAFPSDRYAVASQLKFHHFNPETALIEIAPRAGEECIYHEDIEAVLEAQGDEIALVLMGGVNYYTGQFFDLARITNKAKEKGCVVGFDLAHVAGNVLVQLHDWNIDFAAWCHYKYINAGPGATAGIFVHQQHHHNPEIPRFAGWWGTNKDTRFKMLPNFEPIQSAEAWQLSNVPVFSTTPLRASLELFDSVGMEALRQKSVQLTAHLEYLLSQIHTDRIQIITPRNPAERGCQLSLQVKNANKNLYTAISNRGIIADWREPDVIRVAPVPMYNSFADNYHFTQILQDELQRL